MRTRSATIGRGARRAAAGRSGWRAPAPRFAGVVRGEFLKLAGMRMAWILATLFLAVVCLPHLATFGNALIARNLERDPAATAYLLLGSRLLMVRAAAGICLILLAARLVGMEYSGGTIRVLLARGVGRAQLLAGKLAALALVALGALIAGMGLTLALLFLGLASLAGWAMALRVVAPEFLADTALYAATIAISMGATILMAAGVAVVGRSLSFGLRGCQKSQAASRRTMCRLIAR